MSTRQPADAHFTTVPVLAGLAPEAPLVGASGLHRLVISGHSLVDQPFPDQLLALAARAGAPFSVEQINLFGSSIRQRDRSRISTGSFDAMLITEQHTLLGNLMWNDTEHHLGEWSDALLDGNPQAIAYFQVPWLSVDDRSDPSRWIAYEKAAIHVWQCAVTRINARHAAQGRRDRIVTIPASLALAHLIEHLAAVSPAMSVDQLMSDNVHLTPLGNFYIALVSYLAMTGQSPESLEPLLDAPLAEGVSPGQALGLLRVAQEFFDSRAGTRVVLSSEGCRDYLKESFIDDYWRYVHDAQMAPEMGPLKSAWRAWRGRAQSREFFRTW